MVSSQFLLCPTIHSLQTPLDSLETEGILMQVPNTVATKKPIFIMSGEESLS